MKPITAFLLSLCLCGLAFGQAGQARIVGTVTDSAGAVIPAATVVVKNQRTGVERSVKSNEQGRYVVTNLSPAQYSVVASAPGWGR